MKKIILGEEQSKKLANILREGEQEVYKMPVDKKVNKPYCIDPEKVLIVKKYLDNGFTHYDYENIGSDGFPKKIKIVSINSSAGQPLRYLYMDQVKDLLIDKFQNMFSDADERDLFMGQVLKDWVNDAITSVGGLSTNRLLRENTFDEITSNSSNMNLEPTDAQKAAGNYKMLHVNIKGMKIAIENPKGSKRYFTKPNGEKGFVVMKNHYGYFNVTKGKDGDAVDVFIGPNDDFDTVYCVDQNINGEFDETKVMLGFSSEKEAKEAYLANYSKGWNGFRAITAVSLNDFKKWLYRGRKQRQPFAEYAAIKKCKLNESVIKEEEYNEVIPIARAFDNDSATEIAIHLVRNGIEAYADDDIVYAMIEQDRDDPNYVNDVKSYAKKLAEFYQASKSQAQHQIAEGIEDFDPLDVYTNSKQFNDEPEHECEGWVRVRNSENGKYNLKNTETSELLNSDWFDWVGEMTNGFVIVMNKDEGYNIIGEDGEYVFRSWHEDIEEIDGYNYLIVDGDNQKKINILDFD